MSEIEVIKWVREKFPHSWYSVNSLAEMFGITTTAMKRRLNDDEISTFKPTGSPFVTQDSIIKWFMKKDKLYRDKLGADSELYRSGMKFVIQDWRFIKNIEKSVKK